MDSIRTVITCAFVVVVGSAIGTASALGQAAQATSDLTPPVQLTSEQDHQRLMDLLHISEMRRGPDGDPTSPHAANFDESKVAPYRLPDPLVLKNGRRVTTSAVWWQKRRPGIVADFDSEMYGRVPENVPKVTWQVVRTRHETIDAVSAVGPGREARAPIRVVTKDIVGHLDNSAYPLISVNIQLTLTVPEKAAGPVSVVMEFGLAPAAQAVLRKRFTDAQWAVIQGTGPGWQSQVLAKGWGYAILIPTSVQADNGEGLTQGVIGLTNKGQPRKPGEWGALRAWAWGASRAVDYFETDPSVDARQIGIEGLSRYGKATLVAMAYEPRLAIAFVGSSGEGGAKLSRRTFGEQVENIASSSEYHWMAGNFLKYAGPLTRNDLPVDAHELIALCAPRPVFISGGSPGVEGGWVDVKGTFLAAVAAGPVYELLGKKDLGATEFPPIETALIDGDIAFRQHRAGHTTGPNWPTFLTFASRYVKGPALAQSAGVGGIFEGQSDIGDVRPPGTGSYSAAAGAYTLTSAGSNTWYRVDNFHYLWKKASGDLSLTANVTFPPQGYQHEPNPHRKGILMFRQTLDGGGVYAGVGVHGSGMTALQFRRELAANTEDIELNIDAPQTVRLEKRGDTFTLFVSMKGEPLHQVGASVTMHLEEPFYVGLGAVSHDVATTDEVRFSDVMVQTREALDAPDQSKISLYSTLRTIQTDDQFRRAMVIRSVPGYMQSPNWASDGKSIFAYEDGGIERIPVLTPEAGGTPQPVSVGNLVDCSGNFGLSPDRKWLAVSCAEKRGARHDVYVVPVEGGGGGAPRKVTQGVASSYFHAWSPDSQTIAFTRGSAGKADIFTIAVTGGKEVRLTSDTINDGPDYSQDGKVIYFDSQRSGSTQIWRMKADGTGPEQLTDDNNINSSPHVSPDGKTVAFLRQPEVGGGVGIGDAELRVFSINDGLIRTLASFQGDRGSFSMYGWGDGNHLAFVSYQFLPKAEEGLR
jgi:WD40-like Beta Propeller Repeat